MSDHPFQEKIKLSAEFDRELRTLCNKLKIERCNKNYTLSGDSKKNKRILKKVQTNISNLKTLLEGVREHIQNYKEELHQKESSRDFIIDSLEEKIELLNRQKESVEEDARAISNLIDNRRFRNNRTHRREFKDREKLSQKLAREIKKLEDELEEFEENRDRVINYLTEEIERLQSLERYIEDTLISDCEELKDKLERSLGWTGWYF